ncbi:filamentous hemagglutinin N-terminal domain-containing protein, partial [Marinomonas sp. M1K-6]
MNNLYKVVWNKSRQVWQAVSECASSNGKATKSSSGTRQGASFSLKNILSQFAAGSLLIITLPSIAFANNLPTGGQVQAGAGQINSNGQTMTINQTSQNMVVDWQSFSIGKDASVNFVQPNAQAAALNRVLGNQVSNIRGALKANGQVFLVNPNGILFSQTARVDVGSLVASTLNISNQNFMNGNYRFEGSSGNAVINQGNIQTLNGGTVAFIAAKIINTGSITTPQGNTLMGAGNKVVLDLGGPVKIEVEASELETYIEQGGAIKADGGTVYLTAKAANALTSSVINHTGITQAQTLASGEDGTIMLMGDMQSGTVQVAGTLDASAPISGKGGFVETSAAKVKIDDVQVTTKAENGETGEWLIDPNDYTIAASGGDITGTQLGTNLATSNVTIQSVDGGTTDGNGDIFVNDEVTWTSGNTLTLNAIRNIEINKTIDASGGSGGKLVLEYGQGAVASGNNADYNINAPVNLQAGQNFSTKLGNDGAETTWTVITHDDLATAISTGGLEHNYVLGGDLDLSSITKWTPIGNLATKFTGNFDGLGHTISNLKINNTSNLTGLFGITDGATIKNIGVVDAYIQSYYQAGILIGYAKNTTIENSYTTGKITGTYESIGGLVGYFTSEGGNNHIENSYSSADVTGTDNVGGLVGQLSSAETASISNAYATGNVTGTDNVGGLVGQLSANAMNGGATASISNAYATGNVTGADRVGGLVGELSAYSMEGDATASISISNAYATGNIIGANNVGGLVGQLFAVDATASISNAYATGNVTGTGSLGGLVANIEGGTIENSWYDKDTNTATMADSTNYGKTKAEILAAFAGKDGWSTGGGATVAGYEVAELPYLTKVTADADKSVTTLFAGGMGVDGDAYTITNWNQLQNINYGWDTKNKTYALSNNLESSTAGYVGTGEGWNPIGAFSGNFDGLGHSISDLYINRAANMQGLFGQTEDANIVNVNLINVNITGNHEVGALVGTAMQTHIENVTSSGKVVGEEEVGGLVGYMDESAVTVLKSHSSAEVTGANNIGGLVGKLSHSTIRESYATGKITGTGSNIGGIVGYNNYSLIEDSYATNAVSGGTNVGGLVGYNKNYSIKNSYASGSVTGTSNVGGLVGSNNGTITNSFYATTDAEGNPINTTNDSGMGTGKTMAELQTASTFAGWDLSTTGGSDKVWRIYEDHSAPLLRHFMKVATVASGENATATKTYDATTEVDNSLLNLTWSVTEGSYDSSLIQGEGFSLDSKNAGTRNLVSGFHSGQTGYDIVVDNSLATFEVTAKDLDITGLTAESKTYDANTTASLTGTAAINA